MNIELIYANGEVLTEAQYPSLVTIYPEANKRFNKKFPIAAHREIDRSIKGGHKDSIGFKFDYFYFLLEKKGDLIDITQWQSQTRFNVEPYSVEKPGQPTCTLCILRYITVCA